MTILRDEVQVALNDLHKALKHSAGQYRYVAEFLDGPEICAGCSDIAKRRDNLAARVASAIRASNDLPAEPDKDKETGEQLLQRLEAMFSADQISEVVAQRRDEDRALLALVNSDTLAALDKEYAEVKCQCREEVEQTLEDLAAYKGH
jgi:hypothetical protein